MILEHVVLDVDRDSIEQFESTFSRAKVIIAAAEGFASLRLERCIETRGRYVLLVQWESVEAHEVGFRGSPAYQDWRGMLHHFYVTPPEVQHFETAFEA